MFGGCPEWAKQGSIANGKPQGFGKGSGHFRRVQGGHEGVGPFPGGSLGAGRCYLQFCTHLANTCSRPHAHSLRGCRQAAEQRPRHLLWGLQRPGPGTEFPANSSVVWAFFPRRFQRVNQANQACGVTTSLGWRCFAICYYKSLSFLLPQASLCLDVMGCNEKWGAYRMQLS